MHDQGLINVLPSETPPRPPAAWLVADAGWRLGPRPVGLWLAHKLNVRLGFAHRGLSDWPAPRGRFLPASAPLAPALPDSHPRAVLAAAVALPAQPDWHGGHDPAAHALDLPLAAARPVWEASRLGALPLLAQAARCDPAGGHLARAEALLGAWCAANPPFRGVAWACGQEAALRALHLALALALLDADRDPPPAARALLALCGRRIAATTLYALAQDIAGACVDAENQKRPGQPEPCIVPDGGCRFTCSKDVPENFRGVGGAVFGQADTAEGDIEFACWKQLLPACGVDQVFCRGGVAGGKLQVEEQAQGIGVGRQRRPGWRQQGAGSLCVALLGADAGKKQRGLGILRGQWFG